jgi:hypothetical protein
MNENMTKKIISIAVPHLFFRKCGFLGEYQKHGYANGKATLFSKA